MSITPPKHAQLRAEWVAGEKIQYLDTTVGKWKNTKNPMWLATRQYRVKPPDVPGRIQIGDTEYPAILCDGCLTIGNRNIKENTLPAWLVHHFIEDK